MKEGVLKNPGQGEQIKSEQSGEYYTRKAYSIFCFLFFWLQKFPSNGQNEARRPVPACFATVSQHKPNKETGNETVNQLPQSLGTGDSKVSGINSWPISDMGWTPKSQLHQGQLGMGLCTKSPVAVSLLQAVLWFGLFFTPLKSRESCGADLLHLPRT